MECLFKLEKGGGQNNNFLAVLVDYKNSKNYVLIQVRRMKILILSQILFSSVCLS